jgi:hypothetical protein
LGARPEPRLVGGAVQILQSGALLGVERRNLDVFHGLHCAQACTPYDLSVCTWSVTDRAGTPYRGFGLLVGIAVGCHRERIHTLLCAQGIYSACNSELRFEKEMRYDLLEACKAPLDVADHRGGL